MFLKLFLVISLHKTVMAQINGEFWWLSDKLKHANKIEGPKFEHLTAFDTDENDKIIFSSDVTSDNEIGPEEKLNNTREGKEINIIDLGYDDRSGVVWHTHETIKANETKSTKVTAKKEIFTTTQNYDDEFSFYYPDDKKVVRLRNVTRNPSSNVMSYPSDIQLNSINMNDKITSNQNQNSHESICSYMDEGECRLCDGLVYKPNQKRSSFQINNLFGYPLVCCILPIKSDDIAAHKVIFPENSPTKQRFTRSTNNDQNMALKQRQALIRRISPRFQNFKVTNSPQIRERIITPDEDDDYVDPYANIKNKAFTPSKKTKYQFTKPGYGVPDYDYGPTEELPRPGLVGLYSDGHWSGTWTFENDDVVTDEEEDGDIGYGVSTLDPRLDKRKGGSTAKPPQRKIPVKVSTSEESSYESGSQTVSYQSNPNFNVLQGFKLLNLVRNKSRTHTKNSRKSTTESVYDDNYSPGSVIMDTSDDKGDSEYEEFVVSDEQVFKDCGRTWNDQPFNEREGEASYGSNPWLSLMVRSRQQRRTMCHATLVHPRAAITAASCVQGAVPGEIILYAGLWDISEQNNKLTQQRMASVHLHPRYDPSDSGHDLAILHWNRPLRLGANVQPACLADPHVGDCCRFVGWGGRGQAINERPQWQRASVITPRECYRPATRRGGRIPKNAFCASVDNQGCVTGIGGTLVCSSNGKRAAVGVVVSKESCDVPSPIVLLPAHDWIRRALSGLGIV